MPERLIAGPTALFIINFPNDISWSIHLDEYHRSCYTPEISNSNMNGKWPVQFLLFGAIDRVWRDEKKSFFQFSECAVITVNGLRKSFEFESFRCIRNDRNDDTILITIGLKTPKTLNQYKKQTNKQTYLHPCDVLLRDTELHVPAPYQRCKGYWPILWDWSNNMRRCVRHGERRRGEAFCMMYRCHTNAVRVTGPSSESTWRAPAL